MPEQFTVVSNSYFKGGPHDKFISGTWIGNPVQENRIFISCRFNGVEAEFRNCIFIDCQGVWLDDPNYYDCRKLQLPQDVRLIVQR